MATAVTAADPIRLSAREDIGKLLLRLAVGVLLLFHGVPAFIGYGVYIGEVVAPILVILGVLTRPAALVVAFDLLMAIVLVQRGKFFTLSQSGGWFVELELLYMLGAITIFFLGSGRYAISRGRGRWD
jgi:putative oxidoreductase